jgi:hypothetical protein
MSDAGASPTMFAILSLLALSDPTPLTRAHAHNDYAHKRPLEEALEQGFCSVEADVYLVDGELRVGHDRKDLVPGRTLERLYLDPLLKRVKARNGSVYERPTPFFLLVDVKDDGETTYAVLRDRLPKYREMLTSYKHRAGRPIRPDGRLASCVTPGAVTVVISGNRPVATMQQERERLAFLDGRLADRLWVEPVADLAPMLSESFGSLFAWRGEGSMPNADVQKLTDLTTQVHANGQRLRLWAAPDRPERWRRLYDSGVDLINTDNLKGLADFLRSTNQMVAAGTAASRRINSPLKTCSATP